MTVQRVEPKLRFPLGLLAQFLSQGRKTRRHAFLRLYRFFRSRFPQSAFLPSYRNTSSAGSLRSTGISRFFATMNPSDSQCSHMAVMFSHHLLATLPPPHRVSQVPRLIFPHALSPLTPGGPMAASARCFTIGGGLHHFSAGWPPSIGVTRPDRVHLRYGSRVRSARLRPFGLFRGPPAPLPAERAICRVTSFQVTRSARLVLAHRKHEIRKTRKERVFS